MTTSSDIARHRAEAKALADRFRSGQSLEAALELEPLLGRILSRLSAAQVAASVVPLRAMLKCQASSDWLGLADWLEYDLWDEL